MKGKNILMTVFGLLLAFLLCGACVNSTYAGGIGYSTGGNASSGGGGTGGWVNYDCTLNLLQAGWYQGEYLDDEGAVGNGKYYCPHWIKITGEDYRYLLEKKYMVGKYSGLDTCANDDYVVISGNYRNPDHDYGDGYHGIVIQNFTDETTMLNLHYVGKTTHTIMSVANDVSTKKGYTSVVSYKANGSMSAGFFGEKAGTIGGKDYTYGALLSEVLTTYDLDEINVASFCLSSINEEYDLDVEGRNIYDNTALTSGDIKPAASGNDSKQATRKNLTDDGYRFVCWKDSKSSGKSGCITDTDTSNDPYVSDLVGGSYTVYHKNLTEDHTVYAYYAPKYELTIDAGEGTSVTVERKATTYGASTGSLSSGDSIYKSDELKICLSVTSGYTLTSFKINDSGVSPTDKYCTDVSASQYAVNGNTKVVARAETNKFSGLSLVSSSSGSWSKTNGKSVGRNQNGDFAYTNASDTAYLPINCDSVNGCTVKFWHYLRRDAGAGSTTYKITRTSNYSSISAGTVKDTTTETFSAGSTIKEREEAFEKKMMPGQVVCETLTFWADRNKENQSLTVCALAVGDAQPPDPGDPDVPDDPNKNSGDTSFINIKVRNKSVSKYSYYQRTVYAKPGDGLAFRATYNPKLQYTYNLIPERIKVGSKVVPGSGKNTTESMYKLYNNNLSVFGGSYKSWNNDFRIESSGLSYTSNFNYTNGSTDFRQEVNDQSVSVNSVGKTLSETIKTNSVNDIKSTPTQISFYEDANHYDVGDIKTEVKSRTASVVVPYNYVNTTVIDNDEGEVMYAGETFTLKYKYIVNPRANDLTTNSASEKYATGVPNPQWRVKVIVNGEEKMTSVVDKNDTVLQKVSLSEMDKQRSSSKTTSFNIPDVPAGTIICAVSMIYPANSGGYDSLDANGSNTWAESEQKCFRVAKKPSLQVWGGGVYSAGSINTAVSAKNHLAGVNAYSLNGSNGYHVFGSWAELGVVSIGSVKGFASGASTGYPIGGVENSLNFCERSVLTFANEGCKNNGPAGNLGGSGNKVAKENRSDLIARFRNTQEADVEYEEVTGNLAVGNMVVPMGMTKVVNASGDITITDNIDFLGSYSFSTLANVPKLVLYAKNIKINCNVTRVDAVLIAEENVDTCGNSGNRDISSSIYSNQLKINGAVITNTLTASRTYGASTGTDSIIPAEVVDYDSTLYLWGASNASVSNSGKLTTVYLKELPPRY